VGNGVAVVDGDGAAGRDRGVRRTAAAGGVELHAGTRVTADDGISRAARAPATKAAWAALQVCAEKVRSVEIRAAEIRGGEVRAFEMGLLEDGS
jgi:hypothetical protein